MADGSLGRGGDHSSVCGAFVAPGVWRPAPGETRALPRTRPPLGSMVAVIPSPCPSVLHAASRRLRPSWATRLHVHHSCSMMTFTCPRRPAEVAKEKPRPLVGLQLSGWLLRDLFHRPHLHIPDLARQRRGGGRMGGRGGGGGGHSRIDNAAPKPYRQDAPRDRKTQIPAREGERLTRR